MLDMHTKHSCPHASQHKYAVLTPPGALPWLKDPFDPEGEPLQQVLSSSMLLQLQRAAVSLATMSCLAVLLVCLLLSS